jgi:hypothetical protein
MLRALPYMIIFSLENIPLQIRVAPVIAQFVARSKGYKVEGQTGITGTYPTQCHHDGEVLSF